MTEWLTGQKENIHSKDKAHAWELFGRRGVRKGQWKAEWLEAPYGTSQWELYNLDEDITQQKNVASLYPEKLKELIKDWETYEKTNAVTLPDRPTAYAKETIWNESK